MKKIITVIDASFSLYLTIHTCMVIVQFLQHLVNWPDNFSLVAGVLGKEQYSL